ncbi:superoxide dismutase [Shouchella patagoniensis]|uniref:superoxide dismutase n=1 Tax=Shouchella patagoniensis TaxID=228576 RepID=UPI000994AC1E|nr:superoxide dismutase [Shouchella patagoniensis]
MDTHQNAMESWKEELERRWHEEQSTLESTAQNELVDGFKRSLEQLNEALLHHPERMDECAQVAYDCWVNMEVSSQESRAGRLHIHQLPPLPYAYDALEPYIDEKTMRIHHDKHHQSYVDGLNKAEKEMARARKSGNYDLIKHWEREAAFHGAGHYLHTLFWFSMSPNGKTKPQGMLLEQIKKDFESFEKMKQHFSKAAEAVEGGGWALLIWSPRGHKLEILQAEKHQNLSQQDQVVLLALDVWEHAYYLKHQNERKPYIEAWWNVVYWPEVEERFKHASQLKWKRF